MKALDLLKIVFEIILFFLLLATINTLISGCHVLQPVEHVTTNTEVLYETIKSTNWIASFLLIGFVLGLIGAFGLGFRKIGLATSMACVAGIFLSAALSNLWFYVGAGLVVFASILIVVIGLFLKHRAITEIVTGVQSIRNNVLNSKTDNLAKQMLRSKQSKETQQMVQEIKTRMKLKGEQ